MKKTNKKGFTLVELVIVIAVIAILAGVLIGTFATVIASANKSKALQEWKATVDETYVEFLSTKHVAPTTIKVNSSTKTVDFENKTSAKVLAPNKYVVLDPTNNIYLIWTGDSYSVVSGTLTESKLVIDTVEYTLAADY